MARGLCCTKSFAEFDDNGENYCSLEQLVAPLCAAHKGIAIDICLIRYPKTNGISRRYLHRPPALLYCEGCIWTRIRGRPKNNLVL